MANVRRIFPGGNTAEGFYSFHDNIIGPNRNMLYILKGMPGGGKSSMMKEIGKRAYERRVIRWSYTTVHLTLTLLMRW